MELRAKVDYNSFYCSLKAGKTTEGRGISEDEKARMLKDWPEWFEVIEGAEPEPEKVVETTLEIETPEDKLVVETAEVKTGKQRKK